MMNFRAIITLGPSILDENKLKKIDSYGDCIYRINGAHVDENQALKLIGQIRSILPNAKIMIDLPGNKIRTANLSEPIRLIKGECFILCDYQINYPYFYVHLNKGDIVFANDSIYSFEVVESSKSSIKLLSHSDGLLLSNKGLHVRGIHKNIPFLFERDHRLISMVCSSRVEYLALSFVRTAEDIREAKNKLKKLDTHIIAKIETLSAVKNLNNIFQEVESILIDRGDLSTEIGILKLAMVQERIIEAAKRAKINIYLATQFLKNMETKPVPLISEIVDLCKTVKSGINGIQLSEETAVGRYPVECVKLVFDAFKNSFTDFKYEKVLSQSNKELL